MRNYFKWIRVKFPEDKRKPLTMTRSLVTIRDDGILHIVKDDGATFVFNTDGWDSIEGDMEDDTPQNI